MAAIGQGQLANHKLFRTLRTVSEMMADRKYDVPQEMIPESFEQFLDMYVQNVTGGDSAHGSVSRDARKVVRRDKMTLPCQRRLGHQVLHMIVFFCPPNGLTSEYMKEVLQIAHNDSCHGIIFVAATKPNAIVKKNVDINNRSENCIHMQVFEEDELAVNITRHELVPKHTPLETEEVEAVLQAHSLQLHQLPRLLMTDPVAAYYGLARGNVVRIERRSQSAGVYVTYRQVV